MVNTQDQVHYLTLYDMEYTPIGKEPIKGIFIGDSNFDENDPRDNHCSFKYSYNANDEIGNRLEISLFTENDRFTETDQFTENDRFTESGTSSKSKFLTD